MKKTSADGTMTATGFFTKSDYQKPGIYKNRDGVDLLAVALSGRNELGQEIVLRHIEIAKKYRGTERGEAAARCLAKRGIGLEVLCL